MKHQYLYTVIGLMCMSSPRWVDGASPETSIRENSPLEKLIRESKDNTAFSAAVVPLEKAKFRIPDWLRSHFRRNHSEFLRVAASSDPTGGYPLALESLYLWMLRHQDLQPPPPPSAEMAISATVGQNLRISGTSNKPRSESDIRINFADPNRIIAASNNLDNGRQAQFFSTDGGITWSENTLPLLPADSLHSDPTVDWTSDGTAWATTIGINASSTVLQMRAYKSSDSGKTWVFDGTFSGDQTQADKQMMWVDHNTTSQYQDNIYVVWHNGRPAFAGRRTKSGWQPPVQLSGAETSGTAIGSDITTNAGGDVFVVWPDTGSRNIFLVASKDGGATYSAPRRIAQTIAAFQMTVPAFAERGALVGASIAAFKNQSHNEVYVSWNDLSGEAGCKTANSEPGNDVNSQCGSRIWFSRSTDGGATWESARKINHESSASDQFNQRLAVDPETGQLGIVYYQTGIGAERKKTNLMFQFSSDNGQNWGDHATKITTVSTDETSTGADSGNQYGDYNGLSVRQGVFFPCWTDRRDGKSEAIFTAKITLGQNAAGAFEAVLVPPPVAKP
jgi:hypothetical protein